MTQRDPHTDQNLIAPEDVANRTATDTSTEVVADDQAFQLELEAGPILAELLASGDASTTLGDDIHAAVAALSDDAIGHLDPTAQHLIDSVDLFDVPASDMGDAV